MTPEEIVGLIGNIANRADIREVQARQIAEIKEFAATQLDEIYKVLSDPQANGDWIKSHLLWIKHKADSIRTSK